MIKRIFFWPGHINILMIVCTSISDDCLHIDIVTAACKSMSFPGLALLPLLMKETALADITVLMAPINYA
ncbi:hypothetical protein LOAG_00562 [Loa loa]|uniref:Uncharacterized protein n=1 Tax=Loa loa TaxID=7209 RepID=A0A1S0UBF4_LOALO|nr:hypothetical protein LOAG_00562 [Loa loa]EFO27925.1 hypothetical protein LOAG_00562 [Loa loa]